MISEFLQLLQTETNISINKITPVSGGDINEAFVIESNAERFFLKVNSTSLGPELMDSELCSLRFLEGFSQIHTPQIIHSGVINGHAYLILEHLTFHQKTDSFWENFGRNLAKLHLQKSDTFGFKEDNYIGRLEQKNLLTKSQAKHLWQDRYKVQFDLSLQKGLLSKSELPLIKAAEEYICNRIPQELASPIHGDLWSGNFACLDSNRVIVFDPACSYSHREFDLAMISLFGQVPEIFYNAYNEVHHLADEWERRQPFFQSYYLLVHLNMFGTSYLNQLKESLKKAINA